MAASCTQSPRSLKIARAGEMQKPNLSLLIIIIIILTRGVDAQGNSLPQKVPGASHSVYLRFTEEVHSEY